jgi:hypothetical protein
LPDSGLGACGRKDVGPGSKPAGFHVRFDRAPENEFLKCSGTFDGLKELIPQLKIILAGKLMDKKRPYIGCRVE